MGSDLHLDPGARPAYGCNPSERAAQAPADGEGRRYRRRRPQATKQVNIFFGMQGLRQGHGMIRPWSVSLLVFLA
jgi:hypothetical protein